MCIRDSSGGQAEYYINKIVHLNRYNDVLLNVARRGLQGDWGNSVNGRFDPKRLERRVELGDIRRITISEKLVRQFELFLVEMNSIQVPVVLTFVPTVRQWNELEPQKFANAKAKFLRYAESIDYVHYVDFLNKYADRQELFVDPIHLNSQGQRLVTKDLAVFLNDKF